MPAEPGKGSASDEQAEATTETEATTTTEAATAAAMQRSLSRTNGRRDVSLAALFSSTLNSGSGARGNCYVTR